MTFAGIEVSIITHERAEAAGPEAFGLWCWAMCWCQIHASDGRVPRIVALRALGGRRNMMLAKRLEEVGLWIPNDDGSWTIRNYTEKNQTSEEIAARKEAAKLRKDAWKSRQAEKRNANGTRSGTLSERVPERSIQNKTIQDQTRPIHEINSTAPPTAPPTEVGAPKVAARGTRLPDGWTPSAEAQAWAKAQGVADPCGQILDDFRDYWRALPGARGVKLDWDATYRNRVRQVGTRAGTGARYAARGAEITKQPFDPNAPWMTLPEVS